MTGGGMAAGLQSRYAATDLATPQRRGRALSTVVWATTVGLGGRAEPRLADGTLVEKVGIPELAGPYVLTGGVFAIAGVLITLMLRPDPLLVARDDARGGGRSRGWPMIAKPLGRRDR